MPTIWGRAPHPQKLERGKNGDHRDSTVDSGDRRN